MKAKRMSKVWNKLSTNNIYLLQFKLKKTKQNKTKQNKTKQNKTKQKQKNKDIS